MLDRAMVVEIAEETYKEDFGNLLAFYIENADSQEINLTFHAMELRNQRETHFTHEVVKRAEAMGAGNFLMLLLLAKEEELAERAKEAPGSPDAIYAYTQEIFVKKLQQHILIEVTNDTVTN